MEVLSKSYLCSMANAQCSQQPALFSNATAECLRGHGCRIAPVASKFTAKLRSRFKGQRLGGSPVQVLGARSLKGTGSLCKQHIIRAHSHGHVEPPTLTPVRPFQGSGVDEHFLDDVSSYVFRRLQGVLGPLFPKDFDILDWLPMEIHSKLHKSEVIATLLVREALIFCLDYFLYTMVDTFCRWTCRMYKSRVKPGQEWKEEDYDESVFRALQSPLKFTIVLWSVSRAFYHVAPLFRFKPHLHSIGNTRAVGLILAVTWFLSNWKNTAVRKFANLHKTDAPRIVAADKVVSLVLYYLAASAAGEITGFGLRSLLTVGGISSKKATLKVVEFDAGPSLTLDPFTLSGIAVGLAAKEIVSNFFGGSVLFITRPFVIGEKIKAGQFSGQVQDIGFLQTKILGFDKVPILVPNQAFINQVITNYSRAKGKLLDAVFTVRNQDIFLVERITKRVLEYLQTHPYVDKGMGAPLCYLKSLGPMGTDVALSCVIPTKAGIDYFQAQQSILMRAAEIIVEEGASLGSNAPFSPSVPGH